MTNKSNSLRFRAARLTVCSLLLTAWLPLSYAGSGHDQDSDGGHRHGETGHDHGGENAPATEAFNPDEDKSAQTTPPKGKEDAQKDENHHDHPGSGNDHHAH